MGEEVVLVDVFDEAVDGEFRKDTGVVSPRSIEAGGSSTEELHGEGWCDDYGDGGPAKIGPKHPN